MNSTLFLLIFLRRKSLASSEVSKNKHVIYDTWPPRKYDFSLVSRRLTFRAAKTCSGARDGSLPLQRGPARRHSAMEAD